MMLLLLTACSLKNPFVSTASLPEQSDTKGSSVIQNASKSLVSHTSPKGVERFEYETDCEENVDIIYIARQGTTYNRVDEYCVSSSFEDKLVELKPTSNPQCTLETCGYTTTFKKYLIEPAVLESISGAARMNEVKKNGSVSKFNEQISDGTFQQQSSSSVTKFLLNPQVKCASKLTSSSSKIVDVNLYKNSDSDWRDHNSERTVYMKLHHTSTKYSLILHANRTFTHKGSELHIEEVISCESDAPFSLYDTTHKIELTHHSDYLWGVYASP